jgi:nucleotide-binding universal stress UspA family protein
MKQNSDFSPAYLYDLNIKKILIALDNSPTAQKVAKSGYFFSRAFGAEVILIHVIARLVPHSSPEYSPIIKIISYDNTITTKTINKSILKKATQYFLDKLKLLFGDDNVQTIVADGDYADEILRTAEKLNVDLIVMGSRRHRWLDKIIFGNVAKKVLNHTSIPLLIVPTSKKIK